ncbi:Leucine aminopeptidase 2 [Vanrija pseudolonga]|uniref:Leucine aminopeptidase 2 n=1 Tax=Vanrija pseudolonga TaxID=143232 RepID=A0AAF0YEX8_9TREE|nr:Leucine aminopeptidase 2 [Vanrija pseudolonga]
MSFSELYRQKVPAPQDTDQSTLSNYKDIRTTHTDLEWEIDWDRKVFGGNAVVSLEATADKVDEVILDTSFLDVKGVEIAGKAAEWSLDNHIEVMGQALHVKLPKALTKGETVDITVVYSTTPQCTAVGWLNPNQTKSGKYPYLYSQSQAIHGRSMIPCQDTPAIKATYASRVTSTLPVLMSGLRQSPPPEAPLELGKKIEYVYDQPVAIPSYLIAIASGEVLYKAFADIKGRNWRTGVWTEPETMKAAYWEFEEDTAKQVATAEDLTSAYRFGVYDFLILPDSFPYGGMENCCLTFATPTLIAGDRSLVDVIAHEISHSWFGNSIGCASWGHFWLNEGWTTYLERLIIGKLQGEESRQLSFIIGRVGLKESLKGYENEPRFQRLLPDLKKHEDPDDAFSQVPYEKGSNFLLYLERTVGGLEHFLPYMKDYVKTFTNTSITTGQWRDHLFDFFGRQPAGEEYLRKLGQVDFDEWLHGDGLDLCVDVQYDESLAKPCNELAGRWEKALKGTDFSQFTAKDVAHFSSTQKTVFLDKLGEAAGAFTPAAAKALDQAYTLNNQDNAEIKLRFYKIVLKSGPEYAESAAEWVVTKGRMKFCRPIFRLLNEQAPELARNTFTEHAAFYHPIARKMIAKDLGIEL